MASGRSRSPGRKSVSRTTGATTGRTIGLKIRYDNFKTVTRDRTLEEATADAATIRRAAGECLKRVPLDRRIRLLGVRVGGLTRRPGDSNLPAPQEISEPTLLD